MPRRPVARRATAIAWGVPSKDCVAAKSPDHHQGADRQVDASADDD
jgi:hypothetical protein